MKFRESHLTEYSRLLRLTAAALFLAAGVRSTQAGAQPVLVSGKKPLSKPATNRYWTFSYAKIFTPCAHSLVFSTAALFVLGRLR